MKESIYILGFFLISNILPTLSFGNSDLICNYLYWENLTEFDRNEVLKANIFTDALLLYKGKLEVADNKRTQQLLDTLTSYSRNDKKGALYFYLFNKICSSSDGALSQILGIYCFKIITKRPNYVLFYFSNSNNLMKKYSEQLGYEFYFKKDGTSKLKYDYLQFKQYLTKNIIFNNQKMRNTFSLLFKQIKAEMEKME